MPAASRPRRDYAMAPKWLRVLGASLVVLAFLVSAWLLLGFAFGLVE